MTAATPVIAIVSKQRINGATNGSSTYLLEIARTLAQTGHRIELLQPSPTIAGRTPYIRLRPEMRVFDAIKVRGAVRIGDVLLFANPGVWKDFVTGAARLALRKLGIHTSWTRDQPRPYAVATPWLDADMAFLARHVPASPRAIIADYVFCTPAFASVAPGTPSATVMHDLFSSREGKGQDSVALLSPEDEAAMLARADAIFAIQAREQAFVAQEVPQANALLVPMPVHPEDAPAAGEDDRVLFVGSNTAPNSVGLKWFLEEVWPSVLARRPQCRLDVAGSVGRAFAGLAYPNVCLLGIVDDLTPLYEHAGVVISPLTFGSGLKIKLVEGLAKGKAMVVTSTTLQGVEAQCEGSVVSTDDSTIFARELVRLAGDRSLRLELATAALNCAREHFSAQRVHESLRAWASCLERQASEGLRLR